MIANLLLPRHGEQPNPISLSYRAPSVNDPTTSLTSHQMKARPHPMEVTAQPSQPTVDFPFLGDAAQPLRRSSMRCHPCGRDYPRSTLRHVGMSGRVKQCLDVEILWQHRAEHLMRQPFNLTANILPNSSPRHITADVFIELLQLVTHSRQPEERFQMHSKPLVKRIKLRHGPREE